MYIHPRKTNTFTFFPQAYMENFSWFLTRKLVSFYVRQQHYSIAGREVKKLGAALARHTGQEEGEAVSHIWSRMGILLQRGNAAILGNRIPALPGALIDGIIWFLNSLSLLDDHCVKVLKYIFTKVDKCKLGSVGEIKKGMIKVRKVQELLSQCHCCNV